RDCHFGSMLRFIQPSDNTRHYLSNEGRTPQLILPESTYARTLQILVFNHIYFPRRLRALH
ncbi:hypothetical protein PENTCL1PPCAC_14360, partial [Pristionchus entomophagus]